VSILVSGLINLEITLRIDGFPIEYTPVRYPFFGVNSTVSGVGYNIAKALTTLGNIVNFLSIIGNDAAASLVREQLTFDHIPAEYVVEDVEQTAHSVILCDSDGRSMLISKYPGTYPQEQFEQALQSSALAVLCNINFSRPMLSKARQAGKLIATDVHAISNLDDDYNRDFMRFADILFVSHERLPCSPEEWVNRVSNRYGCEIMVVGLGAEGALLFVRSPRFMERFAAAPTRPVVNTVGAGDALFSCFLHIYNNTKDPFEAIQKAMVFASYKVGATGAADGFLDQAQLDRLYAEATRKNL